jgi:hypothetical protein
MKPLPRGKRISNQEWPPSGDGAMPIHDWRRVGAGIFHHFHQRWISTIGDALNAGLLPAGYYALAEQVVGDMGPDVLPRVRFVAETEMDEYALKQNTLIIHHSSGDRVVALVEIVSPGNKASRHGLRTFVEKAAAALYRGYHLLVLDVHPPGPRDPQGIHGATWEEIADDSFRLPGDKPLTLAAYSAGLKKRAYIEPVAVGDSLPDMPLFLRPGFHILVPLEETYCTAWQNVPQRWRQVLEPQ